VLFAMLPSTVPAFTWSASDPSDCIKAIYAFWFGSGDLFAANYEPNFALWYGGGPDLETYLREKFDTVLQETVASADIRARFQATDHGKVALILLCHQFARPMYVGTPKMFEYDPIALEVSKSIVDKTSEEEYKKRFSFPERLYITMPFLHAESLPPVERSLVLMRALAREMAQAQNGDQSDEAVDRDGFVMAAKDHLHLLGDFGRYPMRNGILGRTSTEKEQAFLKSIPPPPPRAQ